MEYYICDLFCYIRVPKWLFNMIVSIFSDDCKDDSIDDLKCVTYYKGYHQIGFEIGFPAISGTTSRVSGKEK